MLREHHILACGRASKQSISASDNNTAVCHDNGSLASLPGPKSGLYGARCARRCIDCGWATVRSSSGAEPITPRFPLRRGLTRGALALGEQLFRDPTSIHDNTLSCGSCHDTSTRCQRECPRERPRIVCFLQHADVFNAALNFRLNWEGNVPPSNTRRRQGCEIPQSCVKRGEALVKSVPTR